MKTLELTPAELKMIEIAREKEALENKEKAAKKAMQLEKDIQAHELSIGKLLAEYKAQNQAAKEYFGAFPKEAELMNLAKSREFKLTGDYTNPENPSENNWEREVIWSKTVTYTDCQILFKSNVIYVRDHIVYSSTWSSRGSSKGWKMSIGSDSKMYTRVSTVVAKIEDEIKAKEAAVKAVEAKKSALQTAMDKLTKEFPEAKIAMDHDYEKTWSKGAVRTDWNDRFDVINVTLTNGIIVSYRVFGSGQLSRRSITMPKIQDEFELLNQLSNVKVNLVSK